MIVIDDQMIQKDLALAPCHRDTIQDS